MRERSEKRKETRKQQRHAEQLKRDNDRKRELYWYRKINGLCTQCGLELMHYEGAQCARCAAQHKPYQRKSNQARYAQLKAQGLCPGCKKPAGKGRVYCTVCARKWKSNYDYKARYKRLRKEGRCYNCKRKAEDGKARCTRCRKRFNKRRREREQKRKARR